MLKIRFGAVPLTEVKIPQCYQGRLSSLGFVGALVVPVREDRVVVSSHGRHWLTQKVSAVVNCALPLDDTVMLLKVWSYSE